VPWLLHCKNGVATVKRLGRLFLLILFGALAVAGWLTYRMLDRGFSAREEPSAVEKWVATAARRAAIPKTYKNLTNPLADDDQTYRLGMEHFADHCAVCHNNDGNGNTLIGQNLYPKAPVLKESQLSDGELYYTIQNGVRLSGMPAFGEAGKTDDKTTWALVRFIKRLRLQTEEDLQRMKQLNPQTPDQKQEEKEAEDFLNS